VSEWVSEYVNEWEKYTHSIIYSFKQNEKE
jgi:hypothetical protein